RQDRQRVDPGRVANDVELPPEPGAALAATPLRGLHPCPTSLDRRYADHTTSSTTTVGQCDRAFFRRTTKLTCRRDARGGLALEDKSRTAQNVAGQVQRLVRWRRYSSFNASLVFDILAVCPCS